MKRLGDYLNTISILVIINILFFCGTATGRDIQSSSTTSIRNTNSSAYRSGTLIVKFKSDLGSNSAKTRFRSGRSIGELNETFGLEYMEPLFKPSKTNMRKKVHSSFFSDEIYVLHFSENTPIEELVDAYNKLPEVEFAEPDYVIKSDNTFLPMNNNSPNDPDYTKLWG